MGFSLQKMDSITKILNSSTFQVTFENLQPSTEYNITVRALTRIGFGKPISVSFWTATAESSVVEIVDNRTLSDSIIIKFSSGHSRIIKYQIIVEDGRNKEGINKQHLLDYYSATLAKIPYYITAELNAKDLPKEDYHYFVVGDQKMYGKYKNVRLSPGVLYNIRIRIISAKMQSSISEAKQHVIVSYQSDEKFEKFLFGLPFLHFIFIILGMLVLLIVVIFIVGLKVHKYCQNKNKKKNCFAIHDPLVSDAATWSVAYKVSDYETTDSPNLNFEKTPSIHMVKGSLLKTKKIKKENYSEDFNVDDLADYIYNKNIHPSKNFAEEFQMISFNLSDYCIEIQKIIFIWNKD
ncbi:putative tyrosine-protein kinase Wsck [Centruroides sculpturatus]|uniref:putative tyrosine-protein kinase Wsck n=1 Tax=Centruroides sculpturatus TaxID=218467 RepID=UPI000C6CFF7F|nr:putative tyrosine-protein kinase Wsck [Centruroides sculpturatus]